MLYCAATETGFEDIAHKTADVFNPIPVLDDEGKVSFTELFGLISVVAKMKKTRSRKMRSVIDDDENDESIFELLLIAILATFVQADSKYP